jgi:hypothetical protein
VPDIDPGAQYPSGCCDHGWVHLCGGPHDLVLEEQDVPVVVDGEPTGETTRELVSVYPEGHVPERPAAAGGCLTVRCETHCSCFAPDGVHDPDCFLGGSDG